MKLNELTKGLNVIAGADDLNTDISDVAYHTIDVRPDSCFVAIAGNSVDGHDYIDSAVENGAKAIISSRPVSVPSGVTNIVVENTRRALALMSSQLFGEPSKSLCLVGITGTNGKTTITYLLESVWKACGFNTGVVGTVNYRYGPVLTNPKHTTPESYELQKLFKDMLNAGVSRVAMEVSSHSLDQDRVFGCHFDGGIFTNLTQDHLDYHLDMRRYGLAKERLFKRHLVDSEKKGVWAVINIDDPFGCEMMRGLPYATHTYSVAKEAGVFVVDAKYSFRETDLKVKAGMDSVEIKSSLIGRHNASNILAVVAACRALGIPPGKVKDGIEAVGCVPGRLQSVPNTKGLNVLIDYAHTPDALRNVTTTIRVLEPARLITVFGCGGDRDKTKRPLMGFETALKSDLLIVTSDNPRSENPRKIIEEILTGVKKVGLNEAKDGVGYMVEVNRREAIRKAIRTATKEDVVLIAGKGHEDYQIIGAEKYPFDDFKVALEIIENLPE